MLGIFFYKISVISYWLIMQVNFFNLLLKSLL